MSAPNTSTDPKVVIRCGHIIPQIRLTPPDSRPAKAPEVPEQDLGANSLYVPLRTEEVGWEEGGLIWAPKRYCYPTVNLYGGEDDHVIGQYRGGPKGYRFIKITDPAFSLANEDADEDKSKQASSSSSSRSSKGSKSSMPRGPVTTTSTAAKTNMAAEQAQQEQQTTSVAALTPVDERDVSFSDAASSSSSSASSSRQGSFSTDDGCSSGADTGMTTPTASESPMSDEKGINSSKLDAALTALADREERDCETTTCQLAKRTGAGAIPSEPIDAARLGGPMKAQLYNNALGHDRTMTLADSVPVQHFAEHRGRSRAKMAMMDYVVSQPDEYAAGWAYERNTCAEYADATAAMDECDSSLVSQ